MSRLPTLAICALSAPVAALAASRGYETAPFEAVAVAAGVEAGVTTGPRRSVRAETQADHFDHLRIRVEDGVLRIDRPVRGWFSFGRRPDYQVYIVVPTLSALTASSGARATLSHRGSGELSMHASSGALIDASVGEGATVQAHASSGSRLQLAGNCTSLRVEASSGASLDAQDLACQDVMVNASSGSNVSVTAKRRIRVKASSGSKTRVHGKPASVQTDKSSGADITIR